MSFESNAQSPRPRQPAGGMRAGAVGWMVSLAAHAALAAVLAGIRPPDGGQAARDLSFARGVAAEDMGTITLSLAEAEPAEPVARKPAVAEARPRVEAPPPPPAQRMPATATLSASGSISGTSSVKAVASQVEPPPARANVASSLAMPAQQAMPALAHDPASENATPAPTPSAVATLTRPELAWRPPAPPLPARRGVDAGDIGMDVPAPAYPRLSRRLGEQGAVVVEFELTPAGSVEDVRVVRDAGYPRLVRAALDALRRARPHPLAGRRPILVRKSFHFVLH